jgi:hypothetical protein
MVAFRLAKNPMAQESAFSRACAAAILCCVVFLQACGGGGGGGPPPPAMPPSPPAGDPTLPDPQYRVSYLSPFVEGCEGPPVSGTAYTNAEVEPFVAVNPANAANLIGVWQQDRWSNGGAKGLLASSSFDGGRTWTTSMAAFSRCTGGDAANGGDYERATDPWVAIGPDGIAYQIAVSFNGQTFVAGSSNAVLVSTSQDGGRSWSSPITLIRDGADNFNDKESITADPTNAGYAYAVWDRLSAAGHGPSYFSRTTNGGAAWETPRQIYDPGTTSQTLNNQVVVLSDGTLVMFFTQFDDAGGGNATGSFGIVRSTDKGMTWSGRIVVTGVQPVGARDPEAGTFVRDGSNVGAIAAGPHNDLFVVWQDARFSGGVHDDIAFTRSGDGGITWSAPTRINRDPTVTAFEPSIAVRSDGTIGVTYYDFRSNTPDAATLPTDYWITRSSDGVTWRESRVAGPFDLAIAPSSGGLFLGDYQALIAIGELFVPFYAITNTADLGNRTDVFASLVTSAGAAASAQMLRAPEPAMRAQTAVPLPATPELARRLTGSIARTMLRRVPDWTPPWLDRASADIP